MSFTKQEIHAVLELASKFHNEHVSLPFAAADIPDAVHKVISEAYAEVLTVAKTTTHAFGFVLREFANKHVPVVIEALAAPAPVVEPEVVKPTKKSKVVEEKPVVEAEPEPVVEPEAPVEEVVEEKAE